jgi:hypothetical protein
VITSSLGSAPYSYSWSIASGSPAVTLTTGGLELISTLPYAIEVVVVDDKGCTKSIKLTN